MSLQQMIDDLKTRLRIQAMRAGLDELLFTPDELLLFINKAQKYLAFELTIYFVRVLETKVVSQVLDANGAFDLSSLTAAMLEGEKSIISAKLTGGKYCRLLLDDERKENEDKGLSYYKSDPVFYLEGLSLYVKPFADQTLDLCYKKIPTDMAFGQLQFYYDADGTPSTTKFVGKADQGLSAINSYYNGAVIYSLEHGSYHVVIAYVGVTRLFTVSPAASTNFTDGHEFRIGKESAASLGLSHADVDCALEQTVQDLVVDFAEGLALKTAGEYDKAGACFAITDAKINRKNSRYKPVRSVDCDAFFMTHKG